MNTVLLVFPYYLPNRIFPINSPKIAVVTLQFRHFCLDITVPTWSSQHYLSITPIRCYNPVGTILMLPSYYYCLTTAILLLSSCCYRHTAIVLSISSHPYHPATSRLISTSSCIPAAAISILSFAPCYLHSAIPKLLGLEYQWYSDNKDTSANCMWRIVTSIGNNTPTSQLEQWHSNN